jgi:hypothetical protein
MVIFDPVHWEFGIDSSSRASRRPLRKAGFGYRAGFFVNVAIAAKADF